MSELTPINSLPLPALVANTGARASVRFLEFFAANIRNPHTRRAYYRAASASAVSPDSGRNPAASPPSPRIGG
jgi:hypothetical protein